MAPTSRVFPASSAPWYELPPPRQEAEWVEIARPRPGPPPLDERAEYAAFERAMREQAEAAVPSRAAIVWGVGAVFVLSGFRVAWPMGLLVLAAVGGIHVAVHRARSRRVEQAVANALPGWPARWSEVFNHQQYEIQNYDRAERERVAS